MLRRETNAAAGRKALGKVPVNLPSIQGIEYRNIGDLGESLLVWVTPPRNNEAFSRRTRQNRQVWRRSIHADQSLQPGGGDEMDG